MVGGVALGSRGAALVAWQTAAGGVMAALRPDTDTPFAAPEPVTAAGDQPRPALDANNQPLVAFSARSDAGGLSRVQLARRVP